MPGTKNHYNLLKLPRDATPDEIRRAYFDAARRLHPDANPGPHATELFIQVQEAYELLSNPERRSLYDASLPTGEQIEPSVTVNAVYSRGCLTRSEDPQLVYALVELVSTSEGEDSSGPPLNLCLVLDKSTSMQGTRMDMVKNNAMHLLRQLKADDVISIVSFSDFAEIMVPATRGADVNKLSARISMLQASGSTEMLKGLEAGLMELQKNLSPTYINHLILLTDGRTYGDEAACLELAEKAAEQGISISGLGIGHEWNDEFLDKVAACSGGSTMYISAAKDMRRYLEQKFYTFERVYAENATLEFESDDTVELRDAFRIQPEVGPLKIDRQIRLGSIIHSRSMAVMLEFLVKSTPERSAEIVLASGRIAMEIPSRTIPYARLKLYLSRPVSDGLDNDAPNLAVLQAMSHLTLYRLQEKARREVAVGDVARATRHLQYLATHLLAQGERELAHTVLVEAEHIHQTKEFSKEGDKRIKYGTRALLLPPGLEIDKP